MALRRGRLRAVAVAAGAVGHRRGGEEPGPFPVWAEVGREEREVETD